MMWEQLWKALFLDLPAGGGERRGSRGLQPGDVISVGSTPLKHYGIWTGKAVIQYAEDQTGTRRVHQVSLRSFLRGGRRYAICEFPARYGHPRERWQAAPNLSSVVMPQEQLWRIIRQGQKAASYRRYTPQETIQRARSRLGDTGFTTSEHFAMWCKTGIAESHQWEKLREWWDSMVVY